MNAIDFKHYPSNALIYFTSFVLFLLTFSNGFANEKEKRGIEWADSTLNAVATPFVMGSYRAVIIGNNKYVDEEGVWRDLKTAVNGAEVIGELLETDYGFSDVTILRNSNRQDTLQAFRDLSDRVEPNDSVFVYYAGHGHLEEDERRGYWIPADGQGFNNATFIRNSTIRDELNIIASKTKHTLLVSDSCFSGSLLRSGNRGPSQFDLSRGYYEKKGRKKSVQVLAAGGKEFVDDNYQRSGHSPFTYFFINELKSNNQRFISLSELATNIIKIVANNVDQTPGMGVLQGAGDELGEFIFTKVSIAEGSIEIIAARSKPKSVKSFVRDTPLINDEESFGSVVMPTIRF